MTGGNLEGDNTICNGICSIAGVPFHRRTRWPGLSMYTVAYHLNADEASFPATAPSPFISVGLVTMGACNVTGDLRRSALVEGTWDSGLATKGDLHSSCSSVVQVAWDQLTCS
jgi:hypothetical protein